jgi:hypothetical protein
MRTLHFYLIFILINLCFKSTAQQIIIPQGTHPKIDGIITSGEWDDAKVVTIYVQTDWEADVYYKHNDSSLFFAFYGLKGMFGERYPDVLLDINNDEGNSWHADDWWFHASYNDCEGHGIYNNWKSCIPEHPGWFANNFPILTPGVIEIEILYSKIGITNQNIDTLGIAFVASDTYTDYKYFPSNAVIASPSTWTKAIISNSTAIKEKKMTNNEVQVFPNPSSTFVLFQFKNPEMGKHDLSIYNSNGQIIEKIENITGTELKVVNTNWEKGLYFFKLQSIKGEKYYGKFIKD